MGRCHGGRRPCRRRRPCRMASRAAVDVVALSCRRACRCHPARRCRRPGPTRRSLPGFRGAPRATHRSRRRAPRRPVRHRAASCAFGLRHGRSRRRHRSRHDLYSERCVAFASGLRYRVLAAPQSTLSIAEACRPCRHRPAGVLPPRAAARDASCHRAAELVFPARRRRGRRRPTVGDQRVCRAGRFVALAPRTWCPRRDWRRCIVARATVDEASSRSATRHEVSLRRRPLARRRRRPVYGVSPVPPRSHRAVPPSTVVPSPPCVWSCARPPSSGEPSPGILSAAKPPESRLHPAPRQRVAGAAAVRSRSSLRLAVDDRHLAIMPAAPRALREMPRRAR